MPSPILFGVGVVLYVGGWSFHSGVSEFNLTGMPKLRPCCYWVPKSMHINRTTEDNPRHQFMPTYKPTYLRDKLQISILCKKILKAFPLSNDPVAIFLQMMRQELNRKNKCDMEDA